MIVKGDKSTVPCAWSTQSEFLPQVTRIERIVHEAIWSEWHVVTDRGSRSFIVEQEDHIRRLEDGRHVITDSFGMRFLVPAPKQLDSQPPLDRAVLLSHFAVIVSDPWVSPDEVAVTTI